MKHDWFLYSTSNIIRQQPNNISTSNSFRCIVEELKQLEYLLMDNSDPHTIENRCILLAAYAYKIAEKVHGE